MALSRWEIKDRLGHGGVTLIHERTGKAMSLVSQVVNRRRRNHIVEVAIARRIRLRREHIFGRAHVPAKRKAS